MIKIESFTVGPFAENPYLLTCSETGKALLIDPGDEADMLWQAVERADATLAAIILTHAHLDHVGAVEDIRKRANVPVYLHPADNELLANVPMQARMFGLHADPVAPAERQLTHDDDLFCGRLKLEVIHTPGHSPGSVCLFIPSEGALIAGDTLFYRGIGRTDLPGGNAATLLQSIQERLWLLSDDVTVYPGHGPATTIGDEKKHNPFVGERAQWGLI
jgi:hydroxyacylglutathione hydrolase